MRAVALAVAAGLLLLAACGVPAGIGGEPEQPAETASNAAPDYSGWDGRWLGVEGMFVEITGNGAGGYALEMQSDLDTLGTYEGRATAGGIAFERGGETLVLHKASGDETGLKYLAGKQDCLMVADGEGYCRD